MSGWERPVACRFGQGSPLAGHLPRAVAFGSRLYGPLTTDCNNCVQSMTERQIKNLGSLSMIKAAHGMSDPSPHLRMKREIAPGCPGIKGMCHVTDFLT